MEASSAGNSTTLDRILQLVEEGQDNIGALIHRIGHRGFRAPGHNHSFSVVNEEAQGAIAAPVLTGFSGSGCRIFGASLRVYGFKACQELGLCI